MKKPQPPRQSVVSEAWQKMAADMDRFLPQTLQGRKGRWKFSLWLALVELVVLGVVGKFVYDWLIN